MIEEQTNEVSFPDLVRLELEKARRKFGAQRVPHESLGVIREEYLEFEREVFAQHHDKSRMLAELVQIAAMCQRAAEDLGLPIKALADSLAYASLASAFPDADAIMVSRARDES